MGIPEVCLRYRAESLLTCSVPDLHFCDLAVDLESSDFEIDSDCILNAVLKRVSVEAEQKARLARVTVPDQHYFKQSRGCGFRRLCCGGALVGRILLFVTS